MQNTDEISMKKTYIVPQTKAVILDLEALIADSPQGGLNNGDNVGNKKPTDDDDDNCFTREDFGWGSDWDW